MAKGDFLLPVHVWRLLDYCVAGVDIVVVLLILQTILEDIAPSMEGDGPQGEGGERGVVIR